AAGDLGRGQIGDASTRQNPRGDLRGVMVLGDIALARWIKACRLPDRVAPIGKRAVGDYHLADGAGVTARTQVHRAIASVCCSDVDAAVGSILPAQYAVLTHVQSWVVMVW